MQDIPIFPQPGLINPQVQALWAKFAPDKHPDYVQGQQSMHVSILSLCSFSGRMLSGMTPVRPRSIPYCGCSDTRDMC